VKVTVWGTTSAVRTVTSLLVYYTLPATAPRTGPVLPFAPWLPAVFPAGGAAARLEPAPGAALVPPVALARLSRLPPPPPLPALDWYLQPIVAVPGVGVWLSKPQKIILFGATVQVRSTPLLHTPLCMFQTILSLLTCCCTSFRCTSFRVGRDFCTGLSCFSFYDSLRCTAPYCHAPGRFCRIRRCCWVSTPDRGDGDHSCRPVRP
jgi:hypothetical protein